MSPDFKKALYTIACSLIVWSIQDHVAEGRKRDARLTAIESRLVQIEFENRYYRGKPVVPQPLPEDLKPEAKP